MRGPPAVAAATAAAAGRGFGGASIACISEAASCGGGGSGGAGGCISVAGFGCALANPANTCASMADAPAAQSDAGIGAGAAVADAPAALSDTDTGTGAAVADASAAQSDADTGTGGSMPEACVSKCRFWVLLGGGSPLSLEGVPRISCSWRSCCLSRHTRQKKHSGNLIASRETTPLSTQGKEMHLRSAYQQDYVLFSGPVLCH